MKKVVLILMSCVVFMSIISCSSTYYDIRVESINYRGEDVGAEWKFSVEANNETMSSDEITLKQGLNYPNLLLWREEIETNGDDLRLYLTACEQDHVKNDCNTKRIILEKNEKENEFEIEIVEDKMLDQFSNIKISDNKAILYFKIKYKVK